MRRKSMPPPPWAPKCNSEWRKSNVSKPTLYVYFADKCALFEAILEEEALQYGQVVFTFDPDRDAETTLKEFGRAYIHLLCRPGGGSAIRTVMAIAERMQMLHSPSPSSDSSPDAS